MRYGCLSQGGMDTSGLDLVALPIIGLHTYAPPSCQPVVVNKCIHCTNVYYQNAQGGTITMCRDLLLHPPRCSASCVSQVRGRFLIRYACIPSRTVSPR